MSIETRVICTPPEGAPAACKLYIDRDYPQFESDDEGGNSGSCVGIWADSAELAAPLLALPRYEEDEYEEDEEMDPSIPQFIRDALGSDSWGGWGEMLYTDYRTKLPVYNIVWPAGIYGADVFYGSYSEFEYFTSEDNVVEITS